MGNATLTIDFQPVTVQPDLTGAECVRLNECERVIERGLHTFVEVGTALGEIRDARLYRATHGTFEDYCRERWGMARSRAYQYIDAATVVLDVHNCGQIEPPANEAQARELAPIEPELRAEVWQAVVDSAPNGKVTAAHVAEIVERFIEPPAKGAQRSERELSPEQVQAMRDRMAPKMERLKALEAQGVYIGSVWSFSARENYAGDGGYHGNSIPQIVENAILLYTEPDALIVDPMAGSGTTVDVCAALERRCMAFDIQPSNKRDGVITANAMDLRKFVDDESADMVFWHPPYWNMVVYSREKGDISAMPWDEFIAASRKVLCEIKRMLKPTSALVMLSGDKVQGGRFYPITRKLANIAEEIGLIDSGVAIKTTVNSTSQIVKGRTVWAELAHTGNIKVEHDTINIFRKPA